MVELLLKKRAGLLVIRRKGSFFSCFYFLYRERELMIEGFH